MAWASENQNLPGYVVMTELALPQAGSCKLDQWISAGTLSWNTASFYWISHTGTQSTNV